jgi:glutathione S-transferase
MDSNKNNIADHWYPKDLQTRAMVDEYLEWQHNNTRIGCAMFFQFKWLIPLMTGNPPIESQVNMFQHQMEKTLDILETVWLDSSHKAFLATNEISFADILAACELEQPKLANYDPFAGRPKLNAWYQRVKSITNPFYDEAHAIMNKIINNAKPKL